MLLNALIMHQLSICNTLSILHPGIHIVATPSFPLTPNSNTITNLKTIHVTHKILYLNPIELMNAHRRTPLPSTAQLLHHPVILSSQTSSSWTFSSWSVLRTSQAFRFCSYMRHVWCEPMVEAVRTPVLCEWISEWISEDGHQHGREDG